MAMEEADILRSMYTDLEQKLQVDDIKGFLCQNRVISFNEIERLRIGLQFGTTRDLARELVRMLSVKGGHCTSDLLLALEQCAASDNPQSGHDVLILKLKEALLSRREGMVEEGGDGRGERQGGEVSREGVGEGVSEQSSQRGCEPAEPSACDKGDAKRADLDAHSPLRSAGASNEPIQLLKYEQLKEPDKKMERLRVKLAEESQEMLDCFTRFVINVSKLLTSKSVNMDKIQLSLHCRLGSCKVSDDIVKKIDAANSIPALLRMAMPFSSWYNYNLIALLAEEHGEEEGKKLAADYEKKLNIYLQRLVYQCPSFSALPSGKFSSDFDELSVKVDWVYENCTLQDISLFKGKLCKAFGCKDPCCFILKSVEEGCVRVTYIITAQKVPELASKVEQATAKLVEERVISIQVGMNPVISLLQVENSSYSGAKDQQEQILPTDVTPPHTVTGMHLVLPNPHILQSKAEAREQPPASPLMKSKRAPPTSTTNTRLSDCDMPSTSVHRSTSPNSSPTSPRVSPLTGKRRMWPGSNSPLMQSRRKAIPPAVSPTISDESPNSSPKSGRSSPAYEMVAENECPTARVRKLRPVRDSGISISSDMSSEPPSQRNSITSPMEDGHSYTISEVVPNPALLEISNTTHQHQEEDDTTTSDGFSSLHQHAGISSLNLASATTRVGAATLISPGYGSDPESPCILTESEPSLHYNSDSTSEGAPQLTSEAAAIRCSNTELEFLRSDPGHDSPGEVRKGPLNESGYCRN